MTTEQKILMGAAISSNSFGFRCRGRVVDILHYSPKFNRIAITNTGLDHLEGKSLHISELTLLARPVEDMTEEEKNNHFNLLIKVWEDKNSRKDYYPNLYNTSESERYLISIGVLTQELADKLPCKVEWISKA